MLEKWDCQVKPDYFSRFEPAGTGKHKISKLIDKFTCSVNDTNLLIYTIMRKHRLLMFRNYFQPLIFNVSTSSPKHTIGHG